MKVLEEAEASYATAMETVDTLRRRAYRLNVTTTVLAALAGVTLIPAGLTDWVSGILALLTAIVSGYLTQFDPAGAAQSEQERASRLIQARDGTNRLLRRIPTLDDPAGARKEVEDELQGLQEMLNEASRATDTPTTHAPADA